MAVAEKVKGKMPDTAVVESTPRHNSANDGLAERASRTIGERLSTLRYDTQSRYKHGSYAKLCSLAMDGEIFWIFMSRDTHEERVVSHRSWERTAEITRRKSIRLQKPSCSRS